MPLKKYLPTKWFQKNSIYKNKLNNTNEKEKSLCVSVLQKQIQISPDCNFKINNFKIVDVWGKTKKKRIHVVASHFKNSNETSIWKN